MKSKERKSQRKQKSWGGKLISINWDDYSGRLKKVRKLGILTER